MSRQVMNTINLHLDARHDKRLLTHITADYVEEAAKTYLPQIKEEKPRPRIGFVA